MNIIKLLSKKIILACIVICIPYSYSQNLQTANNGEVTVFNINEYEKLKEQNGGLQDIHFTTPEGVSVRYRETNDEYSEMLTERAVYQHKRIYYKPSGVLKYEVSRFQEVEIGTARFYDQNGGLIKEVFYTPDDWLENLDFFAQKHFNVDIWNRSSGGVSKKIYQNTPVAELIHLNGKPITLSPGFTGETVYFAFFSCSTGELILSGERREVEIPELTERFGIGKKIYIVDGEEIKLDN